VVVRFGPVGPRRHDRLEGRAVGASAHLEVEGDGEVRLGDAVGEHRPALLEGGVGDGGGGRHAVELALVLHPPEPLDEVLGGDELEVGEPLGGEPTVLRPGDSLRLQAQAGDPVDPVDEERPLLGHRAADVDEGVYAGLAQLLGRLVAVAAVGDEVQLVGQHEEHPGAAREPGEVPDVDPPRDEGRLAARLLETGAQARHASGHVHGSHANNLATACTASS
jgi:hypothetical protein